MQPNMWLGKEGGDDGQIIGHRSHTHACGDDGDGQIIGHQAFARACGDDGDGDAHQACGSINFLF